MTPDFWHQRWASNQIGFHLAAPNPQLVQYWERLGAPAGATVLVPLCGKSNDLGWLAEQGQDVVGVELSSVACEAFFAERGIEPTAVRRGAHLARRDGPVTLLEGDFFAFVPDQPVAFVYDRAASIALPPDLRPRYFAHLRSLLAPGARLLVVTLDYPQADRSGPPFAVPEDELRAAYAGMTVTLLETVDLRAAEPDRYGVLTRCVEQVWLVVG
jgi:thiopurine S-methyltransferase